MIQVQNDAVACIGFILTEQRVDDGTVLRQAFRTILRALKIRVHSQADLLYHKRMVHIHQNIILGDGDQIGMELRVEFKMR